MAEVKADGRIWLRTLDQLGDAGGAHEDGIMRLQSKLFGQESAHPAIPHSTGKFRDLNSPGESHKYRPAWRYRLRRHRLPPSAWVSVILPLLICRDCCLPTSPITLDFIVLAVGHIQHIAFLKQQVLIDAALFVKRQHIDFIQLAVTGQIHVDSYRHRWSPRLRG